MIKRLILLTLLLKGCDMAMGQSDTVELHWYDGNSILIERPISDLYKSVFDTIPCIMLCSDTSFTLDTLRKFPKPITLIRYTSKEIFWLHGYEVRQAVDSYITVNEMGNRIEKPFWSHREYIGYDKQPLPKNFVVWQSK